MRTTNTENTPVRTQVTDEPALRRGYEALAQMKFNDVPDADVWLALENEALRLVETSIASTSESLL